LTQALRDLRADPDEARRRAGRLAARVRRDHDLHANARRLAALYGELVDGNARKAVQ
jgi:ABC-type nitrate/sulfonate/bicarbonate transport system substrate-binding protein